MTQLLEKLETNPALPNASVPAHMDMLDTCPDIEHGVNQPPAVSVVGLPISRQGNLINGERLVATDDKDLDPVLPRCNPTSLVDYTGIPSELRRHAQWVLFEGRMEKKPDGITKMVKKPAFHRGEINPRINDPGSWVPWQTLVERIDLRPDPAHLVPTFAFTEDDPFVVLDFDHVYTSATKQWTPGVMELVQKFGSYTEASMSGTGLHIICRGGVELSGTRTISFDGFSVEVEIFPAKHFMSLTGKRLKDTTGQILYGEVQDCQEQLDWLKIHDQKWVVEEKVKEILVDDNIPSSIFHSNTAADSRKIEVALNHIPAEDREVWMRIGLALKQYGYEKACDAEAWSLFDNWSRTTTRNNYGSQQENHKQWESFDPEYGSGGITLGTLFHFAQEAGWDGSYESVGSSSGKSKKGGSGDRVSAADVAKQFYIEKLLDPSLGVPTVLYVKSRWFQYGEGKGWASCLQEDIEGDVVAFMQVGDEMRTLCTQHFVRSVLMNLRSPLYCKAPSPMPCWTTAEAEGAEGWMSFANGKVVNVVEFAKNPGLSLAEYEKDGIVKDAGPHFFSKDYVGYGFDFVATERVAFDRFLNRVLPDPESRQMAQELAGVAISGRVDYEAFWVLVGDGGNGKSVFLDVLALLVGSNNVSAVKLGLLGERFQAWPLAENKLNITDELPTDVGKATHMKVEDKLKSFVSGGDVEVEFKGRDKYVAPCTARFVMATNNLPTFQDRSNGMWRRMRVIEFPVAVTDAEKIPKLAERVLAKELPGIWLWAVEGLRSVLTRSSVFEGARSRELKNEHRGQCDPEKSFLTACYEPGDDDYFIPSQYVYNAYRAWCDNNGRKPVSQQKLISRMPSVFPLIKVNQQKSVSGGRKRGVIGMKERPELSEEISPVLVGRGECLGVGRRNHLSLCSGGEVMEPSLVNVA